MKSNWFLLFCTIHCFQAAFGITLKDSSDPISAVVGATVTLICSFNSSKDVVFEWKHEGTTVKTSDTVYEVKISNTMKQLIIKNVKLQNEGSYTCTGSNSEGTAQGLIKLKIIRIKPDILDIPQQYLSKNSRYTIDCSAPNASPKPTYVWSRKNAFFDAKHVKDHGNGSLTIISMREQDEGEYTCEAKNSAGVDSEKFKLTLVNSTVWLKEPQSMQKKAGESFTLEVSLVAAIDIAKMIWLKDRNVVPHDRYSLEVAGAKYTSRLRFDKVNIDDAGEYGVTVEYTQLSGPTKYADLTILSRPIVDIGEGDEVTIPEGSKTVFVCMVQAYPAPTKVQWLRNNTVIPKSDLNQTISVAGLRTTMMLQMNKVMFDDGGDYKCSATNSEGDGSATVKLIVEVVAGPSEKDNNKTVLIVVVVVSVVIILLIVVFVFLYIRFKEAWCGGYTDANGTFYTDLVQEEKDASCLADIEKNPYSIKKNINISMKHADRSGSVSTNGRLFSDTSRAPPPKGRSLSRSLKMSLKSPNASVSENHYAPLDTISSQGKAIEFKHITFDEMLGTGEYGLVNGGRIIDSEDSVVYKDVSIKMLKEEASAQERRDILAELRMMRRISKHPNVIAFVGWCITDDNVYVIEEYAPYGSLLTFLRTQRSLSQSTESLDQLPPEDRVDAKTLLSFSWQIASGMDHLANLQVVHRDLACRNIYLGHEKTCKISEYGLCRDIYAENVYRKTTGGQLPVRWMAREAVFDGQYTTKSDVWSFGVLIWELATLGKIPYPGIVRTEQLLDELESGYHMENPGHISTDLYLLMNSCWAHEPESRPTFAKLRSQLAEFMNEQDDIHIDLQKLFEQEYQDSDDYLKSPTEDCHLPPSFQATGNELTEDPQTISAVNA